MPSKVTIVRDGHSVACVYPRSGFETIFNMLDDASKWERDGAWSALRIHDPQKLIADIDSALNNIENLDLA